MKAIATLTTLSTSFCLRNSGFLPLNTISWWSRLFWHYLRLSLYVSLHNIRTLCINTLHRLVAGYLGNETPSKAHYWVKSVRTPLLARFCSTSPLSHSELYWHRQVAIQILVVSLIHTRSWTWYLNFCGNVNRMTFEESSFRCCSFVGLIHRLFPWWCTALKIVVCNILRLSWSLVELPPFLWACLAYQIQLSSSTLTWTGETMRP